MSCRLKTKTGVALGVGLLAAALGWSAGPEIRLLNVSYDPTRELYAEYNTAFAKHWQAAGGEAIGVIPEGPYVVPVVA